MKRKEREGMDLFIHNELKQFWWGFFNSKSLAKWGKNHKPSVVF